MTEAADAWRELQRRAHESKFSGVSSNTDDLMADADLREHLINPNNAGAASQQAGGSMMPPMMMGGMGGGAGGQQQSSLGGGGAAPGAAAPGGGAAYAPAAGTPAPSAPTVQASGEEAVPEPELGGLGGAPAGGLGGGGGMPAGGEMPGGAPEGGLEDAGEAGGAGDEAPGSGGESTVEMNDTGERKDFSDGVENPDGFTVEEQELQEIAQLWEELSDMVGGGSRTMPGPASLGFAADLKPSSDELAGYTQRWAMQAAGEFLSVAHRLISAKRAYDDIEMESFQIAQRQET